MNQEQKDTLKITINHDIALVEEQIKNLEEKVKPISPDCGLGRLTRLEAMGEQDVNNKILDKARVRLTRLKNALQRINKVMFGICIVCEEDIGIGRMGVRPESVKCIACAD